MKTRQRLRQIVRAAVTGLAALSLAFCLDGAVQLCLCGAAPDPADGCCHECTPESEDACLHVTVQIDAPAVAQTLVARPAVVWTPPPVAAAEPLLRRRPPLQPVSTAPPDSGGTALSLSVRLYPRT